MARLLFMGTPEAAIPALETLNEQHEVGLVVTQPDRPRGRRQEPMPSPVKVWADEAGLTVAQPGSGAELLQAISHPDPFELGVVVAYGRILRPEVLQLPHHGFLNAHFSLLPRWRGAAPVARALMAGDTMTGVTIMRLDEGLDTGPILTAQAVDILADEDSGSLTTRLARLGARLLSACIPPYLTGSLVSQSQSDDGVTYAEKIEPSDRPIDPTASVTDVMAQVRGLSPSPAATLTIDDEVHKVFAVGASETAPPRGRWETHDGAPIAGLGDGGVRLIRLQPPGKRPMSGEAWARGRHHDAGTIS